MPWAITPFGIGEPVGARAIAAGWSLAEGEAFIVDDWHDGLVLSADGLSLEPGEWTPVPEVISDRQFFHGLAKQAMITEDEALDAVGPGIIPATLDALIDAMPQAARFDVRMILRGATIFERHHPLTEQLATAFGWTQQQIDDFWRFCAAL